MNESDFYFPHGSKITMEMLLELELKLLKYERASWQPGNFPSPLQGFSGNHILEFVPCLL